MVPVAGMVIGCTKGTESAKKTILSEQVSEHRRGRARRAHLEITAFLHHNVMTDQTYVETASRVWCSCGT